MRRPSFVGALRGLPTYCPVLLALLLGLCANPAAAIGLGDANTSSRLGQLLQVRIAVNADASEEVSADCIRLEGPRHETGDDIPWLRAGRLRLETINGKPVLAISSVDTINSPVLMFAVRVDCGTSLRREYTLLLNPAGSNDQPAIEQPTTVRPEGNQNKLRTTQGESLLSIARSLFPNDRALQARYITQLRSQNPGKLESFREDSALPSGTELLVPEVSAILAASPVLPVARERREPIASPTPSTPRPRAEARPPRPTRTQPKLVLGSADSSLQMATRLEGRKELSEPERERLRVELQLIATLDEKIATQLELSEKLRQLEALQTRLQSDVLALESRLQSQQIPLASAPAVIATPTEQTKPAQPQSAEASQPDDIPWWLLALIAASLFIIAFIWRQRRQPGEAILPELPSASVDVTPEPAPDNLFEPLSEEDIWPDLAPGKPPATRADLADLPSLSEHGPASVLHIVEDVEEHDSAVELADIMMSFGRVHGAAQTLADFIRANPRQAVKPWVKLLEVYKSANMHSEFDALSQQLNKTFNVKPPSWDDFEVAMRAPESLEHLPHVQNRLIKLWGTRDCQAWLHELLRDNRQGTRQGFPLAIVDEILLLLAILESSLGAYRPDLESEGAAQVTLQPATLAMTTERPLTGQTSTRPEAPQSYSDFDLGLDTAGLSRTLHINLDDLPDDDTQTSLEPRRFTES